MAALHGRQIGLQQQLGEPDDGVHRRANLVAHVGQEGTLGGRSLFSALGGFAKRDFQRMAIADVAYKAHEQQLAGKLDSPHRQPHGHVAPVFTQPHDLAASANDLGRAGR